MFLFRQQKLKLPSMLRPDSWRDLNRVHGNHRSQCARGCNSTFGENRVEFFECALDTHPRSVFVQAEFRADFGELPVFKITQQNSFAVGFLEFVHGVIERRAKFFQSASIAGS